MKHTRYRCCWDFWSRSCAGENAAFLWECLFRCCARNSEAAASILSSPSVRQHNSRKLLIYFRAIISWDKSQGNKLKFIILGDLKPLSLFVRRHFLTHGTHTSWIRSFGNSQPVEVCLQVPHGTVRDQQFGEVMSLLPFKVIYVSSNRWDVDFDIHFPIDDCF